MAIYELYGSTSEDIDQAKASLEQVLGIEFSSHDSSYHGEYFQWGSTGGEHYVLKINVDPSDGEPAESEFSESKVLLYINDTTRGEELQAKIEQAAMFTLLRREDLD